MRLYKNKNININIKILLALSLGIALSLKAGGFGEVVAPLYKEDLSLAAQQYALRNEQIDQFEQAGYLIIEKLFDPLDVQIVGEKLSRLFREANEELDPYAIPGPRMEFRGSSVLWKDDQAGLPEIRLISWAGAVQPDLFLYGRSPKLTVPVAQLLGSLEGDYLINQADYKIPHEPTEWVWHQDIEHRLAFDPHWEDINGRGSFVQVFIAIDAGTLESGPLSLIPLKGEVPTYHLLDKGFQEREAIIYNLLAERGLKEPIKILLKSGDALFLHPKLVYCIEPNRSKALRRSFLSGFAYPRANKQPYPGKGCPERVRLVPPSRQ